MPKVLIVDDEPKSLYTMEMLLYPENIDIVFADCGRAALEKVETEDPDLLLLDVMMPDMTGYEVTRRLKNDPQRRHIPIILVTALDRQDDIIEGLEADADEFLSKPVHGPELRARVRSALRMKQQHDQIQETVKLREKMADMLVHDMKSPVTALLLYADILTRYGEIPPKQVEIVDKMRYQVHRLNTFLGDLLLLVKMRSGSLQANRCPGRCRQLVPHGRFQSRRTSLAPRANSFPCSSPQKSGNPCSMKTCFCASWTT